MSCLLPLAFCLLPVPTSALWRHVQVPALASAQAETSASAALTRHPWPCKNGNTMRTGQGSQTAVGPGNLSEAAWVFEPEDPADAIYQSPVVDHEQNVIFGSSSGTMYSLTADGRRNWARRLPLNASRPAGLPATPVLLGDALYASDGQGCLVCLSLATGEERWRRSYAYSSGNDAWSLGVDPGSGTLFSLAFPTRESSLRCPYGGTLLYAHDLTDGSVRWSYELRQCSCNVMPAVANRTLVFSDAAGGVYALDAATGAERWVQPGNGAEAFSTAAAAVGDNGMVYVPSNLAPRRGVLRAYALETGELRWSRAFDREANAGAALYRAADGRLLVALGVADNAFPPLPFDLPAAWRGTVFAYDAETGREAWQFQAPVWTHSSAAGSTMERVCLPDSFTNPSVDAVGMLYIGWMGGIVFAINGTSGLEVSQYSIRSGMQAAPAIGRGMLVAASCRRVAGFLRGSGPALP